MHVWPCALLYYSSATCTRALPVNQSLPHMLLWLLHSDVLGLAMLQDVCERVIASQSHNIHSVMDFEPFGPAGLFLRVTLTFIVIRSEPLSDLSLHQWVFRCCACLLSWGVLCAVCAALGFLLKRLAYLYMQHYDERYNAKSGRSVSRTERLGSDTTLSKQD